MIEQYWTILKHAGDISNIKYRNVVIFADIGRFIVENHVFDEDGEVYEMPLCIVNTIEDAIAYANDN